LLEAEEAEVVIPLQVQEEELEVIDLLSKEKFQEQVLHQNLYLL
jgi:hypothetical protein